MALPFFCQGLRDDLGLQALLGIHFLQAPVFVLQFLHAGHQRGIHAAELGAPFVERGVADAVLAAQLWDWRAALGLLEDGDDLAIGKTGRLHAELSKNLSLENSTFKRDHLVGGLPWPKKLLEVQKQVPQYQICLTADQTSFVLV